MKNIIAALLKFQSEVPKVTKDSSNPFFKSKYADLASIWNDIQPTLAKCELVVSQPVVGNEVQTTVYHSSGESITSRYPIVLPEILSVYTDKNGKVINDKRTDPQVFGAQVTYARRYALSAILGIVTEDDDDGESAVQRNEFKPTKYNNGGTL